MLAVAVTALVWLPQLPEPVAFHWDIRGRVDGTIPASPLLSVAGGAASLGMIIGLALLSAKRMPLKDQRDYVFWLGSLTGLGAAAWLIPAGLTLQAGSADRAELGEWITALAASALYGAIPRYLLPHPHSERV